MHKVAAIVVNWKAREDTRECLQSLLRSSYTDMDVILIDNASADGSADYLRREFPGTLLIENPTNEGFARASNRGMTLALERGAQYLFLFNNDAVVDEHAVERLVDAVERSQDVGLVGPKIFYFAEKDLIWSAGGEVNFWTGVTRHRGIRKRDSAEFSVGRDVDYLTGCALMARREMVERVGLLDTTYEMYGEDADWCLRARKAGFRVVFVPEAMAWHKVSLSSGGEFAPTKMRRKAKSNVRLFFRHARPYHWISIPFCSAAYVAWLVLRSLVRGEFDLPVSLLRGLRDGLKR